MKIIAFRNTGIKDTHHPGVYRVINEAPEGGVDLLIGQIFGAVQQKGRFRSRFKDIAGYVSVLTHIVAEPRYGINDIIRNPMTRKKSGIHPNAVCLTLQNHDLTVGTDRIQIFLYNLLAMQENTLQKETVRFFARIVLHIIGDKVKDFLLAVTREIHKLIPILRSDGHGNMNMAVDDSRHDEFSVKILYLTFKLRQAGVISHIHKFTVFYRQGGGQQAVPVRGKDFGVPDDPICFHNCSFHSADSLREWPTC